MRQLVSLGVLCLVVGTGCRTTSSGVKDHQDLGALTSSNDYSFSWSNEFPGKSSSSSHLDVVRSGDHLVMTASHSSSGWNGSGSSSSSSTVDTAKKQATHTKDGAAAVSFDGNSSDPAQQKGYLDILKADLSDLRISVNPPGDELMAKAKSTIALLETMIPGQSFTWSFERPGKSTSSTVDQVAIKSNDTLTVTSTNTFQEWNTNHGGTTIVTIDTEKKTASKQDSNDGKGTVSVDAHHGGSELATYQALVTQVMGELAASDGNSKSAELLAQRDEAKNILWDAYVRAVDK